MGQAFPEFQPEIDAQAFEQGGYVEARLQEYLSSYPQEWPDMATGPMLMGPILRSSDFEDAFGTHRGEIFVNPRN